MGLQSEMEMWGSSERGAPDETSPDSHSPPQGVSRAYLQPRLQHVTVLALTQL